MLSTQFSDISAKKSASEAARSRNGSSDPENASKSPSRTRSFSDGSSAGLSPSPNIVEPEKRSKDDISISDSPITPRRPSLGVRGLSLQMPPRDLTSLSSAYSRLPLSPKLDPADTYGSPSIPRRSRGLDFSRAATNLHHSTLAEQSSPDSSPTITGRAMNIPNRSNHITGNGDWPNGNPPSLWSTRGDRAAISSSLGSVNMLGFDSSDSSSDDDLMDADEIDESILTTPNVQKLLPGGSSVLQSNSGNNWTGYSPAINSLMNFQRTRTRQGKNNKESSSGSGSSMASPKSRSPPVLSSTEGMNSAPMMSDVAPGKPHSRRESISWAANQLHISGNESDDGSLKNTLENVDGLPNTPGRDGQRGVIRRAVTRRGNMLPKTKGFARIRAALAEESAPIETEVRREAQVIQQVRENDTEIEPHRNSVISTTHSSPSLSAAVMDPLDDIPEDDIMADSEKAFSSSFKQQALQNSKGKEFWETFDDSSHRTPPPSVFLPRGSSSGISDDISMESPSLSTPPSSLHGGRFSISSQLNDQLENLPQPIPGSPTRSSTPLPTAAEITRKLNNKRRRDDDFDPVSFKRRAVSPGISVHNSPVMQSPMQRDVNPWGTRPPSNSGSEKGVVEGGRITGTKRVGLQGMTDTNDGLMKMSIE